MNKDNKITTFNQAPSVAINRSRFPMQQRIWGTTNTGYLTPIWTYSDILPGDTLNLSYSFVCRQTTSLKPTMDDAYIDIFGYAVPHRIVWKHFKEQLGENRNGAWTQTVEYLTPMFTSPSGGMAKGTIAEKMGIPIGRNNVVFSQLPIRAYVMTYNEWFRDQNLIAPLTEYDDDTDRTASNTTTELGGQMCKVAKYHDYFTSCLPEPQKAPNGPVTIPIGTSAPVIGNGKTLGLTDGTNDLGATVISNYGITGTTAAFNTNVGSAPGTASTNYKTVGVVTDGTKSGLIADLSQAVAATINAQRYAYGLQKAYEKDARGGSRQRSIYKQHFGTTMPDARAQIPEYLFGIHIPLNLVQVAQTSEGTSTSPQGNLAAYGHTSGAYKGFVKSFTEHSIILILAAIRTKQSYSQGLNRMWSRRRRFDMYWPVFANLGEMSVKNKELFCSGNTTTDEQTFGFQEHWAEYRYLPDLVTGEFRPDYAQSLDFWLYTSDFSNTPVLNQSFIEETVDNMDRTLTVQSSVSDQFMYNFKFDCDFSRPMPLASIPGLIDHH